MCESNVYLIDEKGEEKLVFEGVNEVSSYGGGLCLENIFYQRKYILAKVKEISFLERKIILERISEDE
ncbi:CooT family nickel-binding protein [Pseudobacteroides cellulosolvens]|uniref:RNA-binding protein n=1 Tax=Pseudobacteroides cellulosolvens ATCC 35603 = DSM 2933 TaxID=398512 RepID=A0A0L6JWC2_9FIRM|nr:CooT family nickel-binding protein [Pseudobacteroides cellulosolvens]KNY30143.1 RNA-binding protein [Pseudobacteroides cellulosolvens ATCC 35603 = DSM 2933]